MSVFHGYIDKLGNKELFTSPDFPGRAVVFDERKSLEFWKYSDTVVSVKSLYWWDGTLESLAKKENVKSWKSLEALMFKYRAHEMAINISKVNTKYSLRDLIPIELLNDVFVMKVKVLGELYERADPFEIDEYERFTGPLLRTMMEIEKNGIHVDSALAKKFLAKKDLLPKHVQEFLRKTIESELVYYKTNPRASRTRRMSVLSGFPAMSIAHGIPRQCVVSRFEGGLIVSFDFNAIDYRCIVRTVDDPALNEFYRDCDDFHTKTSTLLGEPTKELRKITKDLTYVSIYGGTLETLQKKLLLPQIKIQEMLEKLKELFAPIDEFRDEIFKEANESGKVTAPGGLEVHLDKNDHPGKVLGLFAQTFSSFVFGKALMATQKFLRESAAKSKILFPVHDEIILDMHPEEEYLLSKIQSFMGAKVYDMNPYVRVKKGKNYDEI